MLSIIAAWVVLDLLLVAWLVRSAQRRPPAMPAAPGRRHRPLPASRRPCAGARRVHRARRAQRHERS